MLVDSREFLAPWEPLRTDDYFTIEGQRKLIQQALEQHEQGMSLPHVIVGDAGQVVGRITLKTIVRGPFQSCALGYWVGREHNGRGHATKAVAEIKRVAFEELGLHRIEAATLLHNTASQRVLDRQRVRPVRRRAVVPQDRRGVAGHGDLPGADHRRDVTPTASCPTVLRHTP
ncbi:MAG: GNAT family N-acetyltransferase [Kribbellaceae bacterium]